MATERSTAKGSPYRGPQPLDRPYIVTGTGNVVVDVDRLLRDPRVPALLQKARQIVQLEREQDKID